MHLSASWHDQFTASAALPLGAMHLAEQFRPTHLLWLMRRADAS